MQTQGEKKNSPYWCKLLPRQNASNSQRSAVGNIGRLLRVGGDCGTLEICVIARPDVPVIMTAVVFARRRRCVCGRRPYSYIHIHIHIYCRWLTSAKLDGRVCRYPESSLGESGPLFFSAQTFEPQSWAPAHQHRVSSSKARESKFIHNLLHTFTEAYIKDLRRPSDKDFCGNQRKV